jgi:hypothetical protein
MDAPEVNETAITSKQWSVYLQKVSESTAKFGLAGTKDKWSGD